MLMKKATPYSRLCFFPAQHDIGYTFGCAALRFLYGVAVNVHRNAGVGMAQHFGNRYNVDALRDHDAGRRVPETVGVDMGQPVAL